MNEQASIVITAVDKTSQVVKQIGDGVGNLRSQFSALGAAVTGFAALAGVSAFTGMIANTVEAADSMNDLSKKTSLTVETLSGLELAAKQSGTDLEGVAQAINKLGINIAKDGEKFAKIGVTAKEPLEAFKQLADVVSKIEDPQKRAAVAAEALGKSWQSAMPMLAEGGQKIQEMVDKGSKLSGMTKELAEQSDQFNDQIAELQLSFSSAAKRITLEMLPALNDLSKEFALGIQNADGFFDAIQKYGLTNPFQSHEAKLAQLKQEFEQVDFRLSNDRAKSGDEALARSLQQQITYYDALTAKTVTASNAAADLTKNQKNGIDAFIKGSADLTTSADKERLALEALHNAQFILINKQATAELDALAKAQEEYGKAVATLINPLEQQAYQLEQQVQYYGLTESAIQATLVARLEEARFLAAENGAWEQHLAFLDQEIVARKRIGAASSQKEFLDANKNAAEQSAKEWEKFSDDINRALTDALMRGFEDGKSFGQNFVDSLKNSLKTAALKIVVNVATSTGGSLVNSAINAVAGTSDSNGGAGTNYLGLASNANSAYNLYGAGSQFFTGASTGSSSAGLMYANGTQMVGGDGIGALYTANGGWAGVDAGAGAAAGSSTASSAWATMLEGGWVALIPIIGKALFGSTERYLDTSIQGTLGSDGFAGKFGDTYKTTGNIFGAVGRQTDWYPVTDSSADIEGSTAFTNKAVVQGLMSPTEYGGYSPEVQSMLDESLSSQLASITEQSAAFKAAFEGIYAVSKTNLEGLAKVFEDSTLTDKIKDYAVAVDLQFSGSVDKVFADFGEKVMVGMGGAWLPSVEALRASGETWSQALGRLVNESAAMGQILLAMGTSIKDAFGVNQTDAILKSSDALVKLFGSVEKLGESFGAYYQNFYTQEELNKKAMESLTAQFKDIGLVIPSTRAEFRKMVDSLDLASNSGQATFKSLMDLQAGFANLVPAATDVATAVEKVTDSVEAFAAAAEALNTAMLSGIDAQMASISNSASGYMASLAKSIDLEKTRVTAIRDAASESVNSIKGVFSLLEDQVASLYGTVSSTSAMQAVQGNEFITNALATAQSTGYLPDQNDLSKAITAARSGLNDNNFATQFEADRAALILAGNLSQLKDVSGKQLPVAEQALNAANAQLKALDTSLDYYQKQVDELLGINSNTFDMVGSIDDMGMAIVNAIKDQTNWLSSAVLQALQSGAIGSKDAATRLTSAGVATDKITTAGNSQVFVSSSGAVATQDGLTTNTGWRGSLGLSADTIKKAFETSSPQSFYAQAISEGISAAMIDALYGFPAGTTNDWARMNNLPSFAVGTNYVPKDMLALIHEGEAITPKAYNPALDGNNNSRLEKLVEGLTAEVQRLQSIVNDGNKHASRTANAVNGNPEQPMLVETV